MIRLPKKLWFLIAGILLFLTFIISYESVTVPEWKIRVVSKNGNPLPKKAVTETWIDNSLESGLEHTAVLYSDEAGYITFPARTVNVSLFRRLCGIGIKILGTLIPHASTDSYAFVTSPENGFLMYREGSELKSELVVEE